MRKNTKALKNVYLHILAFSYIYGKKYESFRKHYFKLYTMLFSKDSYKNREKINDV